MTEFTPIASTFGGALIGLSAALLMAWEGRIAGISGIASRLLPPWGDNAHLSRIGFVVGLIAAPVLVVPFHPSAFPQTVSNNLPVMFAAGLLVGFGTVTGNGCTSGHGVCGLARLSYRSLAATAIFMVVAIATVFVSRHILGA